MLIAWLLWLELQRVGDDVVEPVTSGPAVIETVARERSDGLAEHSFVPGNGWVDGWRRN